MSLKIFLYKLFFLIFIFLIYSNNVFGFYIKYNNISTYHRKYLHINLNKKNIKNLMFLKKNECFSFLPFQKKNKTNKFTIRNKKFVGFLQENRFKIFYIVKSKDTLNSIAKKSNHNYYELSEFNLIKKPYKILVGQKIWIGDFLIHKNQKNCFIVNLDKNNKKKYISCNILLNQIFKKSNFLKYNTQYKTKKICFFCKSTIKKKIFFFRKKI